MAVSLLLALVALPLALLSALIFQNRQAILSYFAGDDGDSTKKATESQKAVVVLANEQINHELYNITIEFAIDHLLPTCEIIILLNKKMILCGFKNRTLQGLIEVGFWQYDRGRFLSRFQMLRDGIANSNGHPIEYQKVVECIREIANSYGSVVALHNEMEKTCGIALMRDHPSEWEEWRDRHHAMVAAYEPLRKRSEIPELYSPAKPPHWGDVP